MRISTVAQPSHRLTEIIQNSLRLRQISKDDLTPGDQVFVRTCNSLYEIRALGGGIYSVSGGWFDRKGLSPSKVRISGCTWGGSAIKKDAVAACGLHLEFGNRVITTPIQKIILLQSGSQN
jgi:hypothetical protein